MKRSAGCILTAALSACVLGGGEEPPPNDSICTGAEDCSNEQICNLVTQRCAPKNAAAPNQLKAEFECQFGAESQGGPAYYSWNFADQREDFGAICFAIKLSEGYTSLFIFGGGSDFAISTELDLTAGPGDYPVGTQSLVYVDKRGDAPLAFAYGQSGTVTLNEVTEDGVKGHMTVSLERAFGPGERCGAQPSRCGSLGSTWVCNTDESQPVCRAACDAGACPAGEQCSPVSFGINLCVPQSGGGRNTACEMQSECGGNLTCVTGQIGAEDQGFCRAPCDSQGAADCAGNQEICASLINEGSACLPSPCSLGSCEPGFACKPSSLVEAACVTSGRLNGSFDMMITTDGQGAPNVAQGSGSSPTYGSWTATGVGGASTTNIDGASTMVIALGASNDTVLAIGVPARMLSSGARTMVPGFEFVASVLINMEGEWVSLANAISGTLSFTRTSNSVGGRLTASFDINFEDVQN